MLGDHIRKHRLDLGLYQRQVAARIGVTESTIFNWESNATSPSVRQIPKVVAFLGYDPFSQPQSLRERLILRRKLLGLSQNTMAKRLRVDETILWYFEKVSRRPSMKMKTGGRGFFENECVRGRRPSREAILKRYELWNSNLLAKLKISRLEVLRELEILASGEFN